MYSESESSSDFTYWDSDDEDNRVGDPEWEFSAEAHAWEKRRQVFAKAQILLQLQDAALQDIRFLYEEKEEEA